MTEIIDRRIQLATVPNLRGLGGLPLPSGVVTHGLVYRSATLGALSSADAAELTSLGIRRVVDFRTAGERESAPDLLPDSLEGLVFDVLGDTAGDLAAGLGRIGGLGRQTSPVDPAAAAEAARLIRETLGNGRGVALLEESNRHLITTDSARSAYRGFFEILSGTHYAPTLFHCTTGKDRTGWAAASLLLVLGADETTVMADYLQTNVDILPMIEPMLAQAEAAGIDPDLLVPVLTVRESFLGAALDTMHDEFGTIESYVVDGLGLSADHIDALRSRFTSTAVAR